MRSTLWNDHSLVNFLKLDWTKQKLEQPDHPAYMAKLLEPYDLTGLDLLDVGCGIGRLAKYFPQCKYHGIDQSEEMVADCQAQGFDVKVGNIYRLSETVASSDIVVCNAVIFHLGDPLKAMQELFAVTKQICVISLVWRYLPRFHSGYVRYNCFENHDTGESWPVPICTIHPINIYRMVKKLDPRDFDISFCDMAPWPKNHRIATVVLEK